MGHYEDVCKKCFKVLSDLSGDNRDSIVSSCRKERCPEKLWNIRYAKMKKEAEREIYQQKIHKVYSDPCA